MSYVAYTIIGLLVLEQVLDFAIVYVSMRQLRRGPFL